jgi:EpsI family protein
VAEACSGARYLLSSAILGVVFASLIYRSWKRRLLLILASVIVPVLANCLRAYGIILLGYLSNNELAHGIDHIIYGWIFFVVCMLGVFAVAARHAEHPVDPVISPSHSRLRSASVTTLASVAFLACFVTALPVFAASYLRTREANAPAPTISSAPKTNQNWVVSTEFPSRWISPALDSDVGVPVTYRPVNVGADRAVYLFLGSSQSSGRVLDSGERLLNLNSWTLLDEKTRQVNVDGRSLMVRELRTQGFSGKRLIWLWCIVDGTVSNSELGVKLLQAKATLKNKSADVEIVAIAADYEFDAKEANPALLKFLNDSTSIIAGRP